eukprot:COSAG02_NODE_111_length_36009_cov_42.221248_11_plen_66_part_00
MSSSSIDPGNMEESDSNSAVLDTVRTGLLFVAVVPLDDCPRCVACPTRSALPSDASADCRALTAA